MYSLIIEILAVIRDIESVIEFLDIYLDILYAAAVRTVLNVFIS